ncbi:hypothetical protein ATANTOWER_013208 [Ataeniobius toweri]|uniref:Uncharacterized protein n=1 Tax=Ataeniobius toweri TaxID=208326 RepID=A0ABU7AP95_9TELE|nr:hypothetical protein [Ataeniobius toweri]
MINLLEARGSLLGAWLTSGRQHTCWQSCWSAVVNMIIQCLMSPCFCLKAPWQSWIPPPMPLTVYSDPPSLHDHPLDLLHL